MIKFSEKQVNRFLRLGDDFETSKGTVRALHEVAYIDVQGVQTRTEHLSCASGALAEGDTVTIDAVVYRINKVQDDKSGIIECYLSINGGTHGKYR